MAPAQAIKLWGNYAVVLVHAVLYRFYTSWAFVAMHPTSLGIIVILLGLPRLASFVFFGRYDIAVLYP
jgi:hypothetical protein